MQCTDLMKEGGSDVVQVAKQSEQTTLLLVVPHLLHVTTQHIHTNNKLNTPEINVYQVLPYTIHNVHTCRVPTFLQLANEQQIGNL